MKKIGLIINPIAGIGGRVGLKGSDGEKIFRKAIALGAKTESPQKAIETLKVIKRIRNNISIVTYPEDMGENELKKIGLNAKVIGKINKNKTTSKDTINAAKDMIKENVDLLLFAGGDGTARNIYSAVGDKIVTLGIPTGVKIHSGVYAINPKSAGIAVIEYLQNKNPKTKEAEVMDLNEEEYRKGIVSPRLFGFMKIPNNEHFVQNRKLRSKLLDQSLNSIAKYISENMEDETYYIIGPGTTTRRIMELLELKNTLIGVDIIKNKKLVANDVTEKELLNFIEKGKSKIIVTVIGGQGHIFGRGNQQISPSVIKKVLVNNIIVIATKEKLLNLKNRTLLVDTGDIDLDIKLEGYIEVLVGFNETTICRVSYHNYKIC